MRTNLLSLAAIVAALLPELRRRPRPLLSARYRLVSLKN